VPWHFVGELFLVPISWLLFFVCVLLLLLSSIVGLHWLLCGRMCVEFVARPLRMGSMLLWRMLVGRCDVVPPSEVMQGLQPPSEVLLCVLVLGFGRWCGDVNVVATIVVTIVAVCLWEMVA
jgi:hypothetical protein